jgi:hypothetical protein
MAQLPHAAKPKPLQLGIEFRAERDIQRQPIFSAIPEALRQVPGHSGDPWSGQVFTIPDDSLRAAGGLNAIRVAPDIGWKERIRLRAGAHWKGLMGSPPDKGVSSSTKEINQYDSPERGVGSSLVYYSVRERATLTPGPFAEIELRPLRYTWCVAGWSLGHYDYVTDRGWDRYDALESLDVRRLATVHFTHRYVGLRIEAPRDTPMTVAFTVLAGTVRRQLAWEPVALGTQSTLSGPAFLFTVGMSVRFSLRRRDWVDE